MAPRATKRHFQVRARKRDDEPTIEEYREMVERMAAEVVLGRRLLHNEIVLHINGDNTDYRRENLAIGHVGCG